MLGPLIQKWEHGITNHRPSAERVWEGGSNDAYRPERCSLTVDMIDFVPAASRLMLFEMHP
jgi:hypothetical protein